MAETLTGKTIAATYKTLLKAGSNNPVALASGSGSSERLVFGEDDAADVRTALYVTQDRLGIGKADPDASLHIGSGDIYIERGGELNFYADGSGERA